MRTHQNQKSITLKSREGELVTLSRGMTATDGRVYTLFQRGRMRRPDILSWSLKDEKEVRLTGLFRASWRESATVSVVELHKACQLLGTQDADRLAKVMANT